ncbi:proton channel OTOP2-like [Pelobates fuscus]|uniref:proton channel OTOP2-like n=1 Tax=Pelobates fuscus TaxID=191477 RepID=UPI002FE4B45A
MESEQDSSTSIKKQEKMAIPKVASKDIWKKGGRMISWLVGSNVLLFSCTLVTCVFNQHVDIWQTDLLIFMSVMLVLCILWMLFQMFFTWKYKHAILYKDCHAGPIWMRGGTVFFGIGTLVMDCFKIISAVGYLGCEPPVKIIQPIIQAIFVIVQTYFLWVSCKHCVQIYLNSTRCGLMLLMIINLAVWVIAVTEEARHHTVELERYLSPNGTEMSENISQGRFENSDCECTLLCNFVPSEIYYLYPFNIEYNLFAATLIYIMWKNVARKIDDNASHSHGKGPAVRKHVPFLGLISGLSVLAAGLVMFIMYEIGRENSFNDLLSLTSFYFFHVISLVIMSLANLVGIIIFHLDKRHMDNEKNPTRTLDMVLLLGTTAGQYAISYYSIVAMVATNPYSLLNCLTLIYSLLMIVQHSLQNVLIIEGLHRLPPNHSINYLDCLDTSSCEKMKDVSFVSNIPPNASHLPVHQPSRRTTFTDELKSHLKIRKTMKDIYMFLFLSNVIFWIMPAFGARIRFDNDLEVEFYGFTIWAIITNICLPFGIFYRMHSAATLLELYNKQ